MKYKMFGTDFEVGRGCRVYNNSNGPTFAINAEIWEKSEKTRRYGKIGNNIINAEIWKKTYHIMHNYHSACLHGLERHFKTETTNVLFIYSAKVSEVTRGLTLPF
jgi:hypothetical protein